MTIGTSTRYCTTSCSVIVVGILGYSSLILTVRVARVQLSRAVLDSLVGLVIHTQKRARHY